MPEISRRATLGILGTGALAAAGVGVARAASGPGTADAGYAADSGPDNPIRAENRLEGAADWRIGAGGTVPADDLGRQIAGYASATSVGLGGVIGFQVSTFPARPFTVSVYRLGDYGGLGARHLLDSPVLAGSAQPYPAADPATGKIACGWSRSWNLNVPRDWVSGAYLAAFTTDDGHRSYTPFVVRDDARTADFAVVLPFTTYQAYNQWPLDGVIGKSLYYGYGRSGGAVPDSAEASTIADPHGFPVDYTTRARTVSFDRPYSGVGLPQRYDIDHEFVQWAERSGYDLVYATSNDLHDGRVDASRYSALVFPGHDEYWSAPMRAVAEAAVAGGRHLAYLAANNVYWHARFEPAATDGAESRELTCYKTDGDPAPDASGPTTLWRELGTGGAQAEQSLIGVQFYGIPVETVPLVVCNAAHWFWQGSGVRDGDSIAGIVGGEADGLDHAVPGPPGAEQTILSVSPFQALDAERRVRNQHTSLYRSRSGSLVFAAGTFNWTAALNRPGVTDPRIQRATANLFSRLSQRPS